MKLNLGCGDKYLDGYVNVDAYADRVDVRADLVSCSFPFSTADEILLIHVIEHFRKHTGSMILRKCYDFLNDGGKLIIETHDRQKALNLIRDGKTEGLKAAVGVLRAWPPGHKRDGEPSIDPKQNKSGSRRQKEAWHAWLQTQADRIQYAVMNNSVADTLEYPKATRPGERHMYLWECEQLASELEKIGFTVREEDPQTHGRRTWRDFRLVATK